MALRTRLPTRGPLVTVIMSTYNRAGVIRRALESVVAQTYQDWELCVVGHATPDRTAEVVASVGDPRIRFHNLDHRVPDTGSATKNYALEHMATGEWVSYLDDDDAFLPHNLATFVAAAQAHPDEVFFYARSRYRDARTGRPILGNPFRRWLHGYSREKLQRYNFLDINCVMHRRSLVDEVGMFKPEFYFNDYELWLRISERHDFHYINAVLTDRFVSEPPFLARAWRKGLHLLRHGRSTPYK